MSLPHIPKVSQLLPGIVRILGMNPSAMTLQGTNSYLIGNISSKSRILIDTSNPDQPDYIENIRQYLQETCKNQPRISDIILTHWHPDHIGSVPDVMKLTQSYNWPTPNVYKYPSISHEDHDTKSLINGQILDLSECGMGSLQVLFTPGHTDDHICLLLMPENIIFSGDLILGNGSTTFEDLTNYMESLRILEKIEHSISMILPGHGVEIRDPTGKIEEYLQHRLGRIKQVYESLNREVWQSDMDIVAKVYDLAVLDNPILFMGALKNQNEALKYLLHLHGVEMRDCTELEKNRQTETFSGKMWRKSDKKLANL